MLISVTGKRVSLEKSELPGCSACSWVARLLYEIEKKRERGRIVSNEWRVLRMAIQKLVIHGDQRRQLSLEKSIVEDSRHCSVMKTDEEELL